MYYQGKITLKYRVFSLVHLGTFALVFLFPQVTFSQSTPYYSPILEDQSLRLNNEITNNWAQEVARPKEARVVTMTAYTSLRGLTDSNPWVTASGSRARYGIVACNFLPFGTIVKFPELYGNQEFVVEDRMAWRNSHKVDIWLPDYSQAKQFGVQQVTINIY